MERSSPETKSLVADDRGAVMVVGVFMSAFLVGALWYIIGVGDAIVYHEFMQDGADATAFAAAVYHARGMNIIAMLNLIMAALLAVLVALKIIKLLVTAVQVVSCALAWTGVGAALCAASTSALEFLNPIVESTEKIVDAALKGLNKAATGVAMVTPIIAEGKAILVARDYAPTVHGGLMVSASLVPSSDGFGLPVEDDDFKVLCKHAGSTVASVVLLPIPSGALKDAVTGAVGSLIATFSGYFCGGSGSASMTVSSAAYCEDDNLSKAEKKKCKKDAADAQKKAGKGGMGGQMNGDGKSSKRVRSGSQNGDDSFAVYALVWGDLKSQSGANKGVEVAAWNKRKTSDPSMLTKFQVAQAEFYYDNKKSGDAWKKYKDDTMWNMRWRARLRRVRPPGDGAGAMAGGVMSRMGDFSSALGGAGGAAMSALSLFGQWSGGAFDPSSATGLAQTAADLSNYEIIH